MLVKSVNRLSHVFAFGEIEIIFEICLGTTGFNGNVLVPGIKQEINDKYFTQVTTKSVNFDKTLFIVQYEGNDYVI